MPTYPLPTLAPTIDSSGITAPPYSDIFASLQASMRAIFGQDLYLEPDSQDGQALAIIATAINDTNNAIIAVYNGFSPTYAQGVALSSLVKINGITRNVATNSTATVRCVGQVGTVITNGQAYDVNLQLWNLPPTVTIPLSGQIDVTATAVNAGAIQAPAGTINTIATPTRGWQTVTSTTDATPGAPVEGDAALRRRQADSVALPALGNLEGIMAAVASVPGIQRYKGYENQYSAPDANGIPGHSIAIIVQGGDDVAIANAIALKKSPGTGTYGTISEVITDAYGIPVTINFFPLTVVTITVQVTIKALTNYASTTGTLISQSVASFISGLDIGIDVYQPWLYVPAGGCGNQALGETYKVTNIQISRTGTPGLSTADVVIAFNEAAS